jgi:hypothetical protein
MRVVTALLACLCLVTLLQACTTTPGPSAVDQAVAKRLVREGYKPVMVYNRRTQKDELYFCKQSPWGRCTTVWATREQLSAGAVTPVP